MVALFYLVLNRTAFGAQLRASAELRDVARLMGVKPDRVLMIAFAISGAIAGVVGAAVVREGRGDHPALGPRPDDQGVHRDRARRAGLDPGRAPRRPRARRDRGRAERDAPRHALGYQPAIVFAAVIAILILRPRGLGGTTLEAGAGDPPGAAARSRARPARLRRRRSSGRCSVVGVVTAIAALVYQDATMTEIVLLFGINAMMVVGFQVVRRQHRTRVVRARRLHGDRRVRDGDRVDGRRSTSRSC